MKWTRTPHRRAGKGDLLEGRWLVQGYHRYWTIKDLRTDVSYPADQQGAHCYFASMQDARNEAERLARQNGHR